jgi:hypothetical protein
MALTQTQAFLDQMNAFLEKREQFIQTKEGTFTKIEPRTRKSDYTEAMSFEVYDPLWMLGRQRQFGRFQGNNCGTTVEAKVTISTESISRMRDKNGKLKLIDGNSDPLEYQVERQPRTIDPYARIESALHFLEMKSLPKDKEALLKTLIRHCPLDPFIPDVPRDKRTVEDVKAQSNVKMDKLYRLYGKRCFDGYKLYLATRIPFSSNQVRLDQALAEYKLWFKKKYLVDGDTSTYWNEEKLGYETGLVTRYRNFITEDYHTGRLSWYSFDYNVYAGKNTKGSVTTATVPALPSPATFPGAPNRRLWEFENRRVRFNDWRNDDTSALASSVILQYTLMYSNDWMILPVDIEAGTRIKVVDIEIKDSFGKVFHIKKNFESDNTDRSLGFQDRWAMFSHVRPDAYEVDDFSTDEGLLIPPTLQRVEQGAPIEEVQFLRDEMANMVWGVEERVSDGCGGSLDSRSRSDKVLAIIDEERMVDDSDVRAPQDVDYSYLIQNRVPLHWIPFIPQNLAGNPRDIVFRRARMPIWYNDDYNPVRPSSQLLAVKKDKNGKVIPRFIYEEEIQGYGTKVGLYPQRTRWFNGTSFTWQGFEKKISGTQANSGLMFDALLDVEKKEE